MKIPEDVFSTLTDEQKKRVETAKTPEDLITIAKETGYELTQEQLDMLYGGKSSKLCNDTDWCTKNTCSWNW